MMRVNGGIVSRSRFGARGNCISDRVSKEIHSRQLYAEARGIEFETDTIVIKADKKRRVCDFPKTQVEKKPKNTAQSTIGFFGCSSSKGRSSGNFFEKMVRDIEERDTKPSKTKKSSGESSWIKGMSKEVPEKKKDSIERSIKWMESLFEKEDNVYESETACVTGCVTVTKPMNDAVRSDVFASIRNRIGSLLLHDLPHEVTCELRRMGQELEQLSATVL